MHYMTVNDECVRFKQTGVKADGIRATPNFAVVMTMSAHIYFCTRFSLNKIMSQFLEYV